MCEPVSITMATMAVLGAGVGAHDKAKAEGQAEDARRKGQIEMVKQMNFANADLKLQAQDKGEQARQQLTDLNLKALRNRGMVAAAIGESNLSGNSMNRIKRVTDAEVSREKMGVVDNYQRDYQTIFANQVGNVENTKSQLKSSAPVFRTSKLAQALDVVGAGMGGAASGYSVDQQIKAGRTK
ncbi:virion core protein, T7 gp14 family [Ectopseudomonas khazarica]|uniref:virion core protein, T7 gp14 family n=1 Tax=Ectopseudomonas khazarica TaxID=2502979 RepID=UPI003B93F2FA